MLFFSILPVVPSKRAGTESVEEAGQATSHAHEGTDHVPSHRRNVDPEGVPVALSFATVTTLLSIVHTDPLHDTVISHLSPSDTPPPPEITKSPDHNIDWLFIVFMFVPLTSVACFASRAV